MTFNLRYGTADDGENSWPHRRDLVFDVIREGAPDVLGVQEALRFQLDEIATAFPEYAEVGVGRDDGGTAGEFTAILYRADRFEATEQGTFWFSESPDEIGSTGWGARLPRICTWVRLAERGSHRFLFVYNVHFDHESQESRERSAMLLVSRIVRRAGATPVVVTGDFNAGEDNAAILYLKGRVEPAPELRLVDSFRVLHPDSLEVGTFNGFTGATSGSKIDGILVSGGWEVESAAIVRTSRGGRYPSDHFPVVATLKYRGDVR
jgi:endonuclease/exonuclease/phosphatase family metal-dependent hydrolase